MILKPHVRAALEIARRFRCIPPDSEEMSVSDIIADAMLEMFPADESEPITPEWCNANSLRHEDEWRWAIHDNPHICILNGKAGGWSLHLYPFDVDDDWDALVLREDIKTRGDVRAFLRGMGIDMKGSA